ncbi:transcriptional regulator [Campylobacter jejuni]|nr:transcriptional regulator [Campylobacter jejuni]EAJ4309463.1 transcriptional regulator [Campylobacter jejuni]EAM0367475.1 transcriptional regulator [Campylobacter jejuni]ECK2561372.1 transcriptional regulator [Campylobacter jejuni]ECR0771443.1 transcriptional regulator [Campylobacter jejuni]
MTAQEVKDFCKEYNFTYKDLAQKLGWSEPSLRATIASGKISEQTSAAINLLKETIELKKQLKDWETIKTILKNI